MPPAPIWAPPPTTPPAPPAWTSSDPPRLTREDQARFYWLAFDNATSYMAGLIQRMLSYHHTTLLDTCKPANHPPRNIVSIRPYAHTTENTAEARRYVPASGRYMLNWEFVQEALPLVQDKWFKDQVRNTHKHPDTPHHAPPTATPYHPKTPIALTPAPH